MLTSDQPDIIVRSISSSPARRNRRPARREAESALDAEPRSAAIVIVHRVAGVKRRQISRKYRSPAIRHQCHRNERRAELAKYCV